MKSTRACLIAYDRLCSCSPVNPFPTPGIPGFLRDRIATRARVPSSRMTDPYDARLKECVHSPPLPTCAVVHVGRRASTSFTQTFNTPRDETVSQPRSMHGIREGIFRRNRFALAGPHTLHYKRTNVLSLQSYRYTIATCAVSRSLATSRLGSAPSKLEQVQRYSCARASQEVIATSVPGTQAVR